MGGCVNHIHDSGYDEKGGNYFRFPNYFPQENQMNPKKEQADQPNEIKNARIPNRTVMWCY